jgi:hypothetical protein
MHINISRQVSGRLPRVEEGRLVGRLRLHDGVRPRLGGPRLRRRRIRVRARRLVVVVFEFEQPRTAARDGPDEAE